ncbi:two-component sensor histidine kinase BarA [Agarivorans sp. B2Z047]|uniref:two-component sensor histidine kinase BarA n=1 Tax=Agarivorans sp. B2Z047 TaxID=2652721 RepID=UPI00128DC6CD|nr:two-component sensor histidine kinase BarA [Agarivorans sp. B2Z047]MPW29012.1 two-component sensor histidine kinase BarA [Agarivorans sp. B2Z047]UQN41566.1 two-component sensor histidine kinase BarA [Agarivorans sp. B2Z047]
MTKYGLRARVYILTIIPTLFVGILLASYFTFNRNQQLDNFVIEQGVNVIEPLAIASEVGLSRYNREKVKSLISVTHRKMSPLIKSIAVYDKHNQLFVTSNYHRNIRLLQSDPELPLPQSTQVEIYPNRIILRAPIWAEAEGSFAAFSNGKPELLGYISMQYNKDRALLLQFRDTTVALFIVLFGVLISVLFAFQLSKQVTQPITNMVNIVDRIRQGRLDARVDGSYTGELGLLKHGINSMAKSLAEYHEEMHQSIDQATSDLRETLEQIEIQNIELDIAKKEAQQGAKAKSEFLANMSHELRTPLNGVIGFARQLLKTQLNSNQADYLLTIEKSANNLLAIINDILDFSKLEAGKLKLERIDFNFRDTINDVVTLLAPSAQDKNLELNLLIEPNVPEGLRGDPLRLQQVFTNLLGNAIKFTHQGEITVAISLIKQQGQQVVLNASVKDTGIGISKEQQSQLFQAFKQADTSINREYGGTGLGLVITQKLVQHMGGDIKLSSEPEKGAVFSFDIHLEQANMVLGAPLPLTALSQLSVLLYEPHQVSQSVISGLAQQWQLPLQTATDDAQWQSAIKDFSGTVIIGHSDWQTLEPLQKKIAEALERSSEVIVLINSSDPDIHQRVIEAGAKHCMSKPINHRKLAQALVDEKIAVNDVVTPMAKVSRSKLVLKVLAVDDNAANLKLISAMLHELVTQVDTCTNGLEAITKAEEESYDLILMDIQMPILDGISATQKIRQNSKNEQTPIIAVTAHALAGEKEQLLGQGVDDYLAKPIDESSLEKLIHRWQPNAKLLSREDFAATLDQPKTIEFENASLSWKLAMQRANNNQALAIDMFVMLQDSFVEIEEAIEQILNQQINADEFVLLVHRFRGGCAYSGCKRLESLTTTIEDSLRQHGDVAQVEPELLELSDEIEKVKQAAKQLNQQQR